jgi:hypothetical protein
MTYLSVRKEKSELIVRSSGRKINKIVRGKFRQTGRNLSLPEIRAVNFFVLSTRSSLAGKR